MRLEVSRLTIPEVLKLLEDGKWQIPKFQREFIWTQNQVFELLHSVFRPRPIGLITTWVQPEGKPHCEAERIKLKAADYGEWKENPAVVKFVLDGRQRLTTLAIAFGGLQNPDDRYQFSGRWFLNLDAEPDSENLIVYLKRKQVEDEKFTSLANCLAHGQIPLHEYREFAKYNQNIRNRDIYPKGELPAKVEERSQRFAQYYDTFNAFQLPVAELPEVITLAEVCDIFDVLNTTGTKVSTFDLIHNLIFAETSGCVNLREKFAELRSNFTSLGLLCDPDRPEYFCQTVTGCYLAEPNPSGRKVGKGSKASKLQSIKGGDLIDTPFEVYRKFLDNAARVDTYASDLFSDVLGTSAELNRLAYPVSLILYLALRWRSDMTQKIPTDRVNNLFRAFYWRNALSGRYDQGYLNRFASDLTSLTEILVSTNGTNDGSPWCKVANERLDALFGTEHRLVANERLEEFLMDGEIYGALKQALSTFLWARVRNDLVDAEQFDRTPLDKRKFVQLHHIFPADWCRNNWSLLKDRVPDKETINCFANLVPMKAESNLRWKAMAPNTAIHTLQLDFDSRTEDFERAYVDKTGFDMLVQAQADPYSFWRHRAALMAKELVAVQKIC